jgi:transcription elongation factor GreA
VATKTETFAEVPTLNPGITISEAFQVYVRQLPDDAKQRAQPEIAKFVRWVGGDRQVTSLAPAEVGEYSDTYGARTSSAEATERLSLTKQFLAFLKKKGHVDINLAQHLRLRKSRVGSSRGRAMASRPQAIKLTRAGYADLSKKLLQLQEERVRLAAEIQRAAADKDVRENAPLEAARENQGMVAGRIREIEATLKLAVVIDGEGADNGKVHIGSKVTLTESESGRPVLYQLVEPNEASPLNGKISIVSPVGSAILGRARGDEVIVVTPAGQQTYRIDSTT